MIGQAHQLLRRAATHLPDALLWGALGVLAAILELRP